MPGQNEKGAVLIPLPIYINSILGVEFIYCKNPDAKKPILVVDTHIGFDEEDGPGIMGGQFLNELFGLSKNGVTEVEVWVNTPGGKMMEGYNMATTMKEGPLEVDTLNIGMAASVGGWLQLSGRRVRMMDYSTFMCHDPKGESGKKDEATDAMTLSVAKLISEGSGRNGKPKLTMDETLTLMARTTFLTAEECLEMGLCDEIVPSGENAFALAGMSDKWAAGKHYLNSVQIIKKKKMENIALVTNELDLNEDSNAKAIAKSISKMKNELGTTTEKLTSVTNDLTKIKNEMEDVKKERDSAKELAEGRNDYDDVKKERDEWKDKCNKLEEENANLKKEKVEQEENAKKEGEAAKEKELENNCKNMVNSYKNKLGTDETVLSEWVDTAKTLGLDKVKNMLDKLPLFRQGTKVHEIVNKAAAGDKPAENMADVMAKMNDKRKANLASRK